MAVGTAAVSMVTANFVLIGTAPMIVQVQPGQAVVIAVAASLPAANAVGIRLESGDSISITGAGNVYGRSIGGAGKVVAATLA